MISKLTGLHLLFTIYYLLLIMPSRFGLAFGLGSSLQQTWNELVLEISQVGPEGQQLEADVRPHVAVAAQ
jgi:hypothetical protein